MGKEKNKAKAKLKNKDKAEQKAKDKAKNKAEQKTKAKDKAKLKAKDKVKAEAKSKSDEKLKTDQDTKPKPRLTTWDAPGMKIGIVSDIHGRVPRALFDIFADFDLLLFAGDAETVRAVWDLGNIAPLVTVRGNCDYNIWRQCEMPEAINREFEGVRFYMTHRPEDIPRHLDPEVDVVIHGHTHTPRDEVINGVRYLNPGSATEPRGAHKPSCIALEVEDGKITSLEFKTFAIA